MYRYVLNGKSAIASTNRCRNILKALKNQNLFLLCELFVLVLFAIFILHSRESELYRYTLDGKSALAWELPFSRFMGHLSST